PVMMPVVADAICVTCAAWPPSAGTAVAPTARHASNAVRVGRRDVPMSLDGPAGPPALRGPTGTTSVYDALTVKFTSLVTTLPLTLSVTVISRRWSPSGNVVRGTSIPPGTGNLAGSKVGGSIDA